VDFNTIFDSVAEGIMAVDKKGSIVFLNPTAERTFGIKAESASGKKIIECFESRAENDDFINGILDAVYSKEEKLERAVDFFDGNQSYSLYMSSVYVTKSDFSGIIIVFSDITELNNMKSLEKNLKTKQRLNARLSEQNRILGGIFENYMDDAVVDELMDESVSLGGSLKRTRLTVFMIMSPVIQEQMRKMSPQDYLIMLNHYMDTVITEIKKQGGTIIELHSDSILAAFGAPTPINNHADRALLAARAVQKAMTDINIWNFGQGYPELSLKIGLHTDEMLVGIIGNAGASKYQAFGRPINLTARMTVTGKNGEIVMSNNTKMSLSGEYDIYDSYQLVPKGMAEPISVYKVR